MESYRSSAATYGRWDSGTRENRTSRIGEGLRVTGHAGDGTVEAIEDPARRFVLGVLWHPEEDEADRLIGAFARDCREAAAARA